jgi:hypothetical protein
MSVISYLDAFIVQCETGSDPVMECLARLPRSIDVSDFLALHEAALPIQCGLNDAISNGLCDNILGGFFTAEVETDTDVSKGYSGVRQRHHADARLDDILPQSQNQGICPVSAEGICMVGDRCLEIFQVANANGLYEEKVRVQGEFQSWLSEGGTVGDVAH